MKKIVVLGSINADLVVETERVPHAGETVQGESFQVFPGGKGANQAVAAARLYSGSVALLGMLGTDAFASLLRDSLTSAGIDAVGLATEQGSSGVAMITVDGAGQNCIVVVPGANGSVGHAFVEERRTLIEEAPALLLQLETPMEAVEHAAAIASASGVLVILDPAPAQPLSGALLQNVTWLTPNYTEACLLTGRETTAEADTQVPALVDDLLQLGAQNVLLKLGGDGVAIAMQTGERYRLASLPVKVVDTTAAGDAFNGGFATGLAEGMGALEAAVFASVVAAISVTRKGAQPSMPHREEVDAMLQTHAGLSTQPGSLIRPLTTGKP